MKVKHAILGARLKEIREENEWSQDHASAILGIGREHLCRVETGQMTLPPAKFKRVSDLYGISINQIIKLAAEDYAESLRQYLRSA